MCDDHTDLLVFPELSDEAVVAVERFLEDFYTAFQNHYFGQMHRWYHELAQRRPDDDQIPLPLDPSF
jgi:hypothetical protein